MRLDGYVRVSKVGKRQGPTFISPAVQRERLRAQAKANGHTVVKVHEDLDLPGTHSERPGLQAAMSRVERGTVDGVIVARLDRFGRSAIDVHRNLEKIKEADGVLISAAEGIDTSTSIGRFFLSIVAAFAELEVERIGENWLAARTRAVDRGVHVSGSTPLGYLRREDKRLVLDPATEQIVAEAFGRRAAGESWKAIADWMTSTGNPTATGNPQWTIATVRSMIRNRVYLGEARSGDLVKVGAHEPLIDADTWQAANLRRSAHLAPTGSTAGLLSGIIRCAGCSFALKPRIGKSRHGKARRDYSCRPDKAAGRCPAPTSVGAEAVEEIVVERFFSELGEMRARAHSRTGERAAIVNRLDQARAELTAVLDERLAEALGGSDSDVYVATVRQRREAVDAGENDLAAVEDATDLPDPTDLKREWPDMTLQERRAVIGSAYDAIFLRSASSPREPPADRLRFFDVGAAPQLPVRGKRSEIRSVEID